MNKTIIALSILLFIATIASVCCMFKLSLDAAQYLRHNGLKSVVNEVWVGEQQ